MDLKYQIKDSLWAGAIFLCFLVLVVGVLIKINQVAVSKTTISARDKEIIKLKEQNKKYEQELRELEGVINSINGKLEEQNGKLEEQNVIRDKQYNDLKEEIKRVSERRKRLASRGASTLNGGRSSGGSQGTIKDGYTYIGTFTATAYNGAEAGGGGSSTASGTKVCTGTIAVDPRIIPLGTDLYVEGYGEGTALDTGGKIKGNRIDVWLPLNQVNAWGRKTVKVYKR